MHFHCHFDGGTIVAHYVHSLVHSVGRQCMGHTCDTVHNGQPAPDQIHSLVHGVEHRWVHATITVFYSIQYTM
jgi:hypothetical protein